MVGQTPVALFSFFHLPHLARPVCGYRNRISPTKHFFLGLPGVLPRCTLLWRSRVLAVVGPRSSGEDTVLCETPFGQGPTPQFPPPASFPSSKVPSVAVPHLFSRALACGFLPSANFRFLTPFPPPFHPRSPYARACPLAECFKDVAGACASDVPLFLHHQFSKSLCFIALSPGSDVWANSRPLFFFFDRFCYFSLPGGLTPGLV